MNAPDRSDRFEEAMLAHLGDCLAFALALTRDINDAEDLVQDTYVRALQAHQGFTPGTNAKAWLFTILRRRFVDRWRRSRRRPMPVEQHDLEDMAHRAQDAVEEVSWEGLDAEDVRRAIEEAVPEPYRLAVRLRDMDGFSYRQIAEILDLPMGTVMSRLHRGREYVRQALVSPPRTGASSPPAGRPRRPAP